VIVFAYCYAHIFHTIRRQNKVFAGHAMRVIQVSTTPGSQTSGGQVQQQQATGNTTADGKLSQTEINVLQTMITIIVVFVLCWGVPVLASFLQMLGVSTSLLL